MLKNGLSFDFRGLLEDLRQDLIRLDERVAEMDKKVHTLANSMPAAKRLQSIPGIGPISATPFFVRWGMANSSSAGVTWRLGGLTPRPPE